MQKLMPYLMFGVVLVVCGVIVACWFVHSKIVYSDENISLTYSHSVSNFPSLNDQIYVKDDVLCFVNERGEIRTVQYVNNNTSLTVTELPKGYQLFAILDDKSVIVQIEDSLHYLNTVDGKSEKLWQGVGVGYCGDRVYFTDYNTLYEAEIGGSEPQVVVSFDELLASYSDGIIYRNDEGIYQLLLNQPDVPRLLTSGDIVWPKVNSPWLVENAYLYTSDYALRISGRTLDMYTYASGEMRRIYEIDAENMLLMAVTARDNELYVSRQYTDLKFWPIKDKQINGIYKYDIQEKLWTKINDNIYPVIMQVDEKHLYGIDAYNGLGRIKIIKVN